MKQNNPLLRDWRKCSLFCSVCYSGITWACHSWMCIRSAGVCFQKCVWCLKRLLWLLDARGGIVLTVKATCLPCLGIFTCKEALRQGIEAWQTSLRGLDSKSLLPPKLYCSDKYCQYIDWMSKSCKTGFFFLHNPALSHAIFPTGHLIPLLSSISSYPCKFLVLRRKTPALVD